MAKAERSKGLLVPTIMTLMALALLVSLGVWQLQRKTWKEGLLSAIADNMHRDPVPLETPARAWTKLGEQEYLPVSVSGHFRNADERHLFAVEDGVAGWHIYTPLETAGGLVVLVNRGFVPDALKDPASRRPGQLEGEVTVVGLVRRPIAKSWFAPAEDLSRNMWYWRDIGGMEASLTTGKTHEFAHFSIDARAEPPNPGGWPKGGITNLDIPNRHLEYAITWFGLAAALLVVFALYVRTRISA